MSNWVGFVRIKCQFDRCAAVGKDEPSVIGKGVHHAQPDRLDRMISRKSKVTKHISEMENADKLPEQPEVLA